MTRDDDPEDERTHALLRAAGAMSDSPPVDVARDAMARLRGRRRGIGTMNELFRIIDHFVRGLSTIFGSPPIDDGTPEKRRG